MLPAIIDDDSLLKETNSRRQFDTFKPSSGELHQSTFGGQNQLLIHEDFVGHNSAISSPASSMPDILS
jgi:hypothetical protein